MAVLIILGVSLFAARGLGLAGIEALDSWPAATRAGLATMLCFAAAAHFNAMKSDLLRMVPAWVPYPTAVLYFTGLCEIAGVVGLLVPETRKAAAIALIVFFVAVFPANVRAARENIGFAGKPATPLLQRAAMQVLFIVLTWWAGIGAGR